MPRGAAGVGLPLGSLRQGRRLVASPGDGLREMALAYALVAKRLERLEATVDRLVAALAPREAEPGEETSRQILERVDSNTVEVRREVRRLREDMAAG